MRAIGFKKAQVFRLVIGEACVMALMGGIIGSALACLCMEPAVNALEEVFKLPNSLWDIKAAIICFVSGTVLSALIGFFAALYPAVKSAKLEPQVAITQGDL